MLLSLNSNTCNNCFGEMNYPFILKCGHVFCFNCKSEVEEEIVDTCYINHCGRTIPEGEYDTKILDLPE